jgi:arylsulfatase A-like enzyme
MRGKGASVYEEGIRVPLIVNDPRRLLTAAPARARQQLTSSVDVAPLLLTIAAGSGAWRNEPRLAHLAARPDLAAILGDPSAVGRPFAAHTTDEVVTEFALDAHAADAPLHVVGVITPNAKYATYSNWEPGGTARRSRGQQTELYDYSSRAGRLELLNLAGNSPLEEGLRQSLDYALREEVEAPLPATLEAARQRGVADYLAVAAVEARMARRERARRLEGQLGSGLTGA